MIAALTDDLLAGRFFSIDVRGHVTGWNPRAEAAFGWSTHHVSGTSLFERLVVSGLGFGPEDLEAIFEPAGAGAGRRVRVLVDHSAGNQLPVELSIVPIKLSKAYELNAFLQDVSTSTASGVSSEVGRIREEHAGTLTMIADALDQDPAAGGEEVRLAGALVVFHIDASAETVAPTGSTGGAAAVPAIAAVPSSEDPDLARAEAERVREQIDAAHAEAQSAREEAGAARQDADAARAELETLRVRLAEAESAVAGAGEASEQVEVARREAAELREQVAAVQAAAEQARAEAEAAESAAALSRDATDDAIRESERLKGELSGLRSAADGTAASAEQTATDLGEARAELSQARSELERAGEELAQIRVERDDLRTERDELRTEIDTVRARLTELEAAAGEAQTELTETREALDTARHETELARADVESARGEVESARADAQLARADLTTAQVEAETAREEIESARGEVETVGAEVETARADLETARADLETARGEATAAREDAEIAHAFGEETAAELETARAEAEQARTQLAAAQAELASARLEVESATERATAAGVELDAARAEGRTLRDELETTRAELEGARAQADAAGQTVGSAQAELGEARAEAIQARSEAEQAAGAAAEARKQAEDAEADAQAAREEAAQVRVSTDAAARQAEAAAEEARKQADEAQKHADALQAELDAARAQADAAGQDIGSAQAELGEARAEAIQARAEAEQANAALEQARADAEAARAEAEQAKADAHATRSEFDAAQADTPVADPVFEVAFDTATVGLAINSDGRFQRVNDAFCTIAGHDAMTLLALEAAGDLTTGDDVRETVTELADGRLLVQLERIADEAAAAEDDHDPVTGLFNRRAFEEELSRHVTDTARHGDGGAALMFGLDGGWDSLTELDPAQGEQLLKTVATALKQNVSGAEMLAHLGGDEFAVLLPHADAAQAKRIAQHIVEAVGPQVVKVGDTSVRITVDVGVALFDERDAGEPEVIHAERVESGSHATIEMDALPARREDVQPVGSLATPDGLVDRIRKALAEDGFPMFAQPIIDLRTSEVTQYELLLRMRDDSGRLMLPDKFLPVAQQAGLMPAIDQWVVRHAIGLINEAAADGRRLLLEVNVSADSIDDPALRVLIEQELDATGIDPRLLVIEITEDAALAKIQETIKLAKWIRSMGCRFALDDFGSTFATVKYLKDMPVDFFKLDGDLIVTLPESRTNQLLLNALMDVARGTGTQTIAVYVPDDETLVMLRQYGIGYGQGNRVGRPRPVGEI